MKSMHPRAIVLQLISFVCFFRLHFSSTFPLLFPSLLAGAALLALVVEEAVVGASVADSDASSPGGASVSSTSFVGSNGSRSKVRNTRLAYLLSLLSLSLSL